MITTVLSLQPRMKQCYKCKYFIKDPFGRSDKCVKLPLDDDYYNCKTARTFENLCGKEGKLYKKLKVNKYKNNLADVRRDYQQNISLP